MWGETQLLIRWHGHSCFELGDNVTVVTDPHDGRSIGINPPNCRGDIILVSHDHFDHNSVKTVTDGDSRVFTGDVDTVFRGIDIRSFQTFHDDMGGEKRGINHIFRIKMDGITFLHLGDLGHELDHDTVKALGPIDVLFIPVGGIFTIDHRSAWSVINAVAPKAVVPMHFKVGGLSLSIDPVDLFIKDAGEVERVGNDLEFMREDLEGDAPLVWVFSL